MAKQDYYHVLGVQRGATAKEIKQAYRRLARKYHPDVNPGDLAAEQKFKDISEAYSVLENPDSRTKYDQFGHQAFSHHSGGFDPFAFSRGRGDCSTDIVRDLVGNQGGGGGFSEGFGSICEDIFGGGSQRSRGPAASSRDLEQTVEIDFADAVRGTTIQLRIPRSNGNTDRLQVKIPAGVDTGSKIRVSGKGKSGRYGGPSGDLYITTQVRPHAYFTRDGSDILCDLPVTLGEVVLGAKIDVPTIDGTISMTVPPGTQNGRTFRLRGKGVPSLKGGQPRDQYVKVRVVLPSNIDELSRELLMQFDHRNPLQPRAHMR
jgi:DnaJ-class molecular chaperone